MKNLLKRTRCYLVGHMEYGDGSEWRKVVSQYLSNKFGVICFDPYEKPFKNDVKEDKETQENLKKDRKTDLQKVHKHMKEVVAFDLAMVDRSDFIICYIDPSIPTYGTVHEIVVANLAKKPIFVCVNSGVENTPLWLLGLLRPYCFFNSFDEIFAELENINQNSKESEQKRWKFLKNSYR